MMPRWLREGAAPPPALLAALDPPEGPAHLDLAALRMAIAALPAEPPRQVGDAGFRDTLRDLFGRPPPAPPRCEPLDLDLLGRRVAAAIDPTVARPIVAERVLATIEGLREPVLAPPEFAPGLDLPLRQFLDERARDWLLPGVGALPRDSVVAVRSHPVFVDAFLLGANRQALQELRWRNLPVFTGWTPLRRFRQRVGYAAGEGGVATDVKPVGLWPEASPLGAPAHPSDPAGGGANLVVVFRAELFRRFPATVVHLLPARKTPDGQPNWRDIGHADDPTAGRVWPVFSGRIGADVTLLRLPLPPGAWR